LENVSRSFGKDCSIGSWVSPLSECWWIRHLWINHTKNSSNNDFYTVGSL
jgi:hypothetical protein